MHTAMVSVSSHRHQPYVWMTPSPWSQPLPLALTIFPPRLLHRPLTLDRRGWMWTSLPAQPPHLHTADPPTVQKQAWPFPSLFLLHLLPQTLALLEQGLCFGFLHFCLWILSEQTNDKYAGHTNEMKCIQELQSTCNEGLRFELHLHWLKEEPFGLFSKICLLF